MKLARTLLLFKKLPFEGRTCQQLINNIRLERIQFPISELKSDLGVMKVIEKMLKFDPENRPSFSELCAHKVVQRFLPKGPLFKQEENILIPNRTRGFIDFLTDFGLTKYFLEKLILSNESNHILTCINTIYNNPF